MLGRWGTDHAGYGPSSTCWVWTIQYMLGMVHIGLSAVHIELSAVHIGLSAVNGRMCRNRENVPKQENVPKCEKHRGIYRGFLKDLPGFLRDLPGF